MTSKRAFFQSRRKAAIGALCLTTGLLSAFGAIAGPASADVAPAVFGAGYDTYVKDEHRGLTAEAKVTGSTCPDIAGSGETAWHFVLDGNANDFLTLDVAFRFGVTDVTLSGLTPKAATDPTFDMTKNFAPQPDGKHAYVFTATTGTLRDAAAHVTPDATLDDFQLSHTCVGNGTTTSSSSSSSTTSSSTTSSSTTSSSTTSSSTTSTTAPTTTTSTTAPTTTEAVLGTVVTQADPSTSVTVKGVQVTRTLPRTGTSSTLPLSQAAVVLVAVGLAFLGAARVRRVS